MQAGFYLYGQLSNRAPCKTDSPFYAEKFVSLSKSLGHYQSLNPRLFSFVLQFIKFFDDNFRVLDGRSISIPKPPPPKSACHFNPQTHSGIAERSSNISDPQDLKVPIFFMPETLLKSS